MTAALWLRNLGAFALQAGLLVLGGAFLQRLFRIRDPRASLAYWRTLLVVCLLLPFCQPWRVVTPPTTEPMVMTALGDEPTVAAVKSPIPLPQPASTALVR